MTYPLWEQLEQLKTATWVDLTHTFDETIPCFSEFERAKVSTLFNVADDGFYVQNWNIVTQYGTHIDAPIHFVEKTRYLHEIDLKELVLPLVVLDFSQEVAADADFILTRDHIKQWETEHGSIEPGTFVAFRSDWSKRWPDIEHFENKDAEGQLHLPGWGLDALQYLLEDRQVQSIGHETFDTDASVDVVKNGDIVGERYVLGQDTYQLELLTNLDQLPTRGAIIYAISPKPNKAPGFPVRAFAIKP
ncbi:MULTISPECIES: cyclase family protein [Staphylococcus]|uniref:cyclase family protein n=1 Tax=Staphylococcus TaxID=1279 RepID=UPI0007D8ED0A|nr:MULTISPECIES: cyclase family protein [Staphylococcus]MCQ9294284.1 cyclase family protein [Staphylococcus cohnii]PIS62507.1 metal-dependent hydrolase [Corynebacterium striatum]SCS86054.1 Metal-dependent hydrolase/cyclase [Staphylococcus cohnii subsp. cohnii]HJE02143.1 cyclase family protein [Staphylococcus auricularis]MBM9447857.1 cyclase family protein [Staphylococcus ureilyticus]